MKNAKDHYKTQKRYYTQRAGDRMRGRPLWGVRQNKSPLERLQLSW